MDVLEHYNPTLDMEAFVQGPVSNDVWSAFIDAVRLCHSFKYWSAAARLYARTGPPAPIYNESAYKRQKRRREHLLETKGIENKKYRAAYLAGSKLWVIDTIAESRKGSPDWVLSRGLITAVGERHMADTMTGHERAEFDVIAFNGFDAGFELTTDVEAMARRWRSAARRKHGAA